MKINVLDHGYVEFIEAWGHGKDKHNLNDLPLDGDEYYTDYEVGIIEAARQSTQGSFRGWDTAACDCILQHGISKNVGKPHEELCASRRFPGDAKLLKYLHDHKHATPFEFAGMIIEVQAPIFVFREWHRHRTQSYNEMSARYTPLPDLYYLPNQDDVYDRLLQARASTNKQLQQITQEKLADAKHVTAQWLQNLDRLYQDAEMCYQQGLQAGIPKELARLVMPVGHYSKMRASANLRNWLAFLTLRMDPAAQWEIREFANAVGQCIAATFPQTWKLYHG